MAEVVLTLVQTHNIVRLPWYTEKANKGVLVKYKKIGWLDYYRAFIIIILATIFSSN